MERHPVSGYAFAGFRLPDWVAAMDLVEHAYDTALATYRLVGWDVAFTLEGPVLVEGNAKPGVMMPQRAARRLPAEQRCSELLAWNLAQAEQDMRYTSPRVCVCRRRNTRVTAMPDRMLPTTLPKATAQPTPSPP